MSGRTVKKGVLLDQQLALHSYLEDLLSEVPDYVEEEVAPAKPVSLVKPLPVREATPEPVQTVIEPPVKTEPEPPMPSREAQHPPEAVTVKTQAKATSIVPEWGQGTFQCLLFNVAGLSLAVPLVKLNGVIHWNENITPMPGHSPAFLGLLRHLEQNVKVMDAARIILPENQKSIALQPAEERINKIILMDEGRWGLACDDVGEVITLSSEDVRWRTPQGKRPWLAGTVSERLCALLDTDVFAEMLEQGGN